uniref:Uncharacterized protein n=1 Tax=Anguilla anguilla TaxID=7936 RepID=A0A0E9RD09_ANGAN
MPFKFGRCIWDLPDQHTSTFSYKTRIRNILFFPKATQIM